MNETKLLERVTVNPKIFGGKPIIRGRRLAVEHVLGMLAVGDTPETILGGYPWLEPEDIQACLVYARRLVGHERVELVDWAIDAGIVTEAERDALMEAMTAMYDAIRVDAFDAEGIREMSEVVQGKRRIVERN